MHRQFWGVVVLALAAGCSDEGGGGDGSTAGSGGTGGTGSSSAGSGGTGQPATAGSAGAAGSSGTAGSSSGAQLGAVSLNILAPSGCALEAYYEDMPLFDGGHPVTATEKNKTIATDARDTDGAVARIACKWMGTAPAYDFTVGMDMTGAKSRALSLRGKAVAGQTLQTNVLVALPDDQPYGGMCTVTTIAADEANHSIWGSVSCDSIANLDGQDACALGDSYFYFENCTAP